MTSPSPLMPTYVRQPVAFTRGEGAFLFDTTGRRYLDCLSGIAVNTLGHAHPDLVPALQEQVAQMIHCANLFEVPLQDQVAERLLAHSGMTNAFFCNSGLEANEAMLKLARLHGHAQGIDVPQIVVFERAFHGRSLATLSATGNAKVQKGFEPLVEGFIRLPFNDLSALQALAARDEAAPRISAVLLEPVQGEGGITAATPEFLQGVRSLCTQHGWLMMLDEIQCGIGRTGRWFAHQWAGIRPDVMSLAKGLASGVPVGAVLADGPAAGLFTPGSHGTTFGGNPLAMRAALTTLEVMARDAGRKAQSQPDGGTGRHPRFRGGARPRPDAGHRAGPPSRRAGEAGAGCRAGHQRDGRRGRTAAACADLHRSPGRRAGPAAGAADPGIPAGASLMSTGLHTPWDGLSPSQTPLAVPVDQSLPR